MLKALCKPTAMHAPWLVRQIQLCLWIDLLGDLAHCVHGATCQVKGLRIITPSEATLAATLPKSEEQHGGDKP